MMSSTKSTIACFGATGGCIAALLACALKEGHYCTALARTPEKLHNLLTTEHDLPKIIIKQYLTIHQGDVKNPNNIAKVLINPTNPDLLVDVIASGVGAYPTFQWSVTTPFPLTDPEICETAIRALYTALSSLASSATHPVTVNTTGRKPLLVVISTAGCGKKRGVPLPVLLPYHYLLRSPLADKKRMEKLVMEDGGRHVRDFVIMRPLFLTDGKPKGDAGLRFGWEWGVDGGEMRGLEKSPTVGYSVSRNDVGIWTFEKVICEGGWEGKCVYLTY